MSKKGEKLQVVFTPHGFTSRTSRPDVALATSDVANGAVFFFHCGTRRSLSHVHQGALGLGQFGMGKVDERRKTILKNLLMEEARWVVIGSTAEEVSGTPPSAASIKSNPAYAQFSIHVYFDKLLDESNGKAWAIMVRALERDFAPPAGKKGGKKVFVYTSPAKVPKAPQAANWLLFDGTSAPTREGELGRLVAADPAARPEVEPYYSLACYVDVAALVSLAREAAGVGPSPKRAQAGQQVRLFEDGWLMENLQSHLNIGDLTQAVEQIAHSPHGDELFEEIHGRESLLNHLAHWDGFEADAIYSQGHQCDHDHGDGAHEHHHGGGHVHGQKPTRTPKQMVLWSWLSASRQRQQQQQQQPGGQQQPQGGEAAKAKKKRKKRNNKNKAAKPADGAADAAAAPAQETQEEPKGEPAAPVEAQE